MQAPASAMDDHITNLQRSMVVPKTPTTPHHYLFLSSLDLFWLPLDYMRMLHFYDTDQQDTFIASLQDSLASVLVPFYPAAGRLSRSDQHLRARPDNNGDDGNQDRMCIDCNDAGVEFIVSVAESVDFRELQKQGFQPCPLFDKLAPAYSVKPSSDTLSWPLLSVQVTKFRSGRGVAVGYAESHVLADGQAWCHFHLSWAECARKVPISLPPMHMRTALAGTTSPRRQYMEKPCIPHTEAATNGQCPVDGFKEPSLTETYFRCSVEVIQELKKEANANHIYANGGATDHQGHDTRIPHELMGGKLVQVSSYEALAAYWWKHITRARRLEGDTLVRFCVLKNMRTRVKPELPASYFGNAIVPGVFVFATAAEILQESLGSTAARIHQASRACSEELMWATIQGLELHGQAYVSKFYKTPAPSVRIISSPHFPFNDVDYGYGRPLATTPAKVEGDGNMFLFPPRDRIKGGVDIFLCLTTEATQGLLEDASLASLLVSTQH